jgi:hypothetical protein
VGYLHSAKPTNRFNSTLLAKSRQRSTGKFVLGVRHFRAWLRGGKRAWAEDGHYLDDGARNLGLGCRILLSCRSFVVDFRKKFTMDE